MSKRILVVDDDKDIVEIYRRVLTKEGYEISCAYNGREGLDILKTGGGVDLVVLDLKMPKMTGDEFLKVLRSDTGLRDTRVLVMSSVLYRYKEIPRYDPVVGKVVRRDTAQDGLSRLGQKAKDTGDSGQLEMDEKPKGRIENTMFFGMMAESESDFEKRVSEDLLERVKAIFGEPYKRYEGKESKASPTAVEERVKDIIAGCFKVERAKLNYNSVSFTKDLGISFIDAIVLRRELEKEFGIKISYERQADIETIGDLIKEIEFNKAYARSFDVQQRKEFRDKVIKPMLLFLGAGLFWVVLFLILGLLKK